MVIGHSDSDQEKYLHSF